MQSFAKDDRICSGNTPHVTGKVRLSKRQINRNLHNICSTATCPASSLDPCTRKHKASLENRCLHQTVDLHRIGAGISTETEPTSGSYLG